MDPEHLRILKAMTPEQKLKAAVDLIHTARALKAAALRAQHPVWSEEEVKAAVREVFLRAGS